jgi:TetR/AcrR family tetracycline transcriptional repressor
MRLERQMVVRAALGLLNEVGLDGLTTRRLAQALDVKGPALYWHFRNKQELIDEMARALLADAFQALDRTQQWDNWLAEGARRLRRELLAYKDGARLLAGLRPSGEHGRIDLDKIFGPLADAGFGMPGMIWAVRTVILFTFGWTMDEQAAMDRSQSFRAPFDPEDGFEFGLKTIIAGLHTRLDSPAMHVSGPCGAVRHPDNQG